MFGGLKSPFVDKPFKGSSSIVRFIVIRDTLFVAVRHQIPLGTGRGKIEVNVCLRKVNGTKQCNVSLSLHPHIHMRNIQDVVQGSEEGFIVVANPLRQVVFVRRYRLI